MQLRFNDWLVDLRGKPQYLCPSPSEAVGIRLGAMTFGCTAKVLAQCRQNLLVHRAIDEIKAQ